MLSDRLKRLKDRLDGFRFWFSYKLPSEGGWWPIGRKKDEENLFVVQDQSWYNLYFDDLTKKQKFTEKDFSDDLVRLFANGMFNTQCSSSPYFKQAASLISNGFSSSTMLGKLRAIELNLLAEKNRFYSLSGVLGEKKKDFLAFIKYKSKDDSFDRLAEISLAEHVCTPDEFVTLLKFELLVRNPKLIEKEVVGIDILDYDHKAMFGPPNIAGMKPLKNAATAINDEIFTGILEDITDCLGIKFIPNNKLGDGAVSLYPIRHFAANKNAIRSFKDSLLKHRSRALNKSIYSLEYPDKDTLSNADKLYTIIKALSNKSIENYLVSTRGLVSDNFKAENLPSKNDFEFNLQYLKNASACLVASDICLILLGQVDVKSANLMRDCFRIEAAQNINMLHGESKNTFMPLIADYYAESINKFAQDFEVTKEELAEAKFVSLKHLENNELETIKNNIAHALYAYEKPRSFTYMGEHEPEENVVKEHKAIGEDIVEQLKEAIQNANKLKAYVDSKSSDVEQKKEIGLNINEAANEIKQQQKTANTVSTSERKDVSEVFESINSQMQSKEPNSKPQIYTSGPLSNVAKSIMKKVSQTGALVDLTENDEVRIIKKINEFGQVQAAFVLNGHIVDCDMEADSNKVNNYANRKLPSNSLYISTLCAFISVDSPNGVLVRYNNLNDLENLTHKETVSLYDEMLGDMFTYIGDTAKRENYCSYTIEEPNKYYINNIECDEDEWKSVIGFLGVQSERQKIADDVLKNILTQFTLKDNIPLTKEAKESDEELVLFGGIYCTQRQKDLVEKYCKITEATPIMVSTTNVSPPQFDKNSGVEEHYNADNSWKEETARVLVESKCALRWFKKLQPDTGRLILIRPNMKLELKDNSGHIEAYLKGEKVSIGKCDKYELYVGNKLNVADVATTKGGSVKFGEEPVLLVKESGVRVEVSLKAERERIEFLRTADVFKQDNGKYYINDKLVEKRQYEMLYELLDLHDNYHMIKSEAKKQAKAIDHRWANEKNSRPATHEAMWDIGAINFDGVYCSLEERALYIKYGNNARIKENLKAAGAKKRSNDADIDAKTQITRNALNKEVRAKTVLIFDKILERELDACLEKARLLGNKSTVAGQENLWYADLIKTIIKENTDSLDGSKELDLIKAQACCEKLSEIERVVDSFMKNYDKRKIKFSEQTVEMVADRFVMPEDKPAAIIEKSVLNLIEKYKKTYAETAESGRIIEKINSRKNTENFKVDEVTTKALERYWRNLEKPDTNRKEFLSILNDAELPQATTERDLEKVQGQSIIWFNRLLANVMDDYIKSNLVNQYKSLQKKLFCKDNKKHGVIWYEEYDEAILDLVAQKQLALGVKGCLLNPLSNSETNLKKGSAYEKDAWNKVRDWTNGVAESVIRFYTDNKEIYSEHGEGVGQQKITRVLCEDYVQKVGGLRKLKSYLRKQVACIMQDKERNMAYAQELGIDIKKSINPSAPLAN